MPLKTTDGRDKMAALFLGETHTYMHTHIYTPHVCTLVHTHLPMTFSSLYCLNHKLLVNGLMVMKMKRKNRIS